MAKTTRSKGRSTRRGGSGASSTKARSKKKASAPSQPSRVGQAVGTAFDGRQADVWGLVLIALGLLAGLGLYVDLAGPVGEGLRVAFGALFGLARIIAPPAIIALGAALIFGRGASAEPHEPETRASAGERLARLGIGSALLFVALAGALPHRRELTGVSAASLTIVATTR